MSAEAQTHAWDAAETRGSMLLVVLALAKLSKDRRDPFYSDASRSDLAKLTRLSTMRVKALLDDLVSGDHIKCVRPGGGREKCRYLLTLRYRRPVSDASEGPVLNTIPLNREETQGRASRAPINRKIINLPDQKTA